MWSGLTPPQTVFYWRRFKKVILNPPDFEPGSWCGAGKLWIDVDSEEYWLTSRPRKGPERRGFAVEIYRSTNGENFSLVTWITKEELSEIVGKPVQSIENQQLLLDPSTGLYHLYLSLDIHEENVAGDASKVYEGKWETYLMTADDPAGPWSGEGFVLRGDREYDSGEARDCTIDIIDGRYFCLYKARKAGTSRVNMALAVSRDGREWNKLGVVKINGKAQPQYLMMNGSIMAGCTGPIYFGTVTTDVLKGSALTKKFAAYTIDYRNLNLEEIFTAEWTPGSRYEHPTYPLHTYSSVVYDPLRELWMMTVEAVDPLYSAGLGLNLEVDRVLLYTSEA